jgi:hypothetical protein
MKPPMTDARKTAGLASPARRIFLSVFLLVSMLAFTLPSVAADKARPPDDATITRQVKLALLHHLCFEFKVVTTRGLVTLTGHAAGHSEKEQITHLAAAIPGVKGVLNNMTLPLTIAGNNQAAAAGN